MNNSNYSVICNHSRLTRIDNNFVRCLECGQSMISQQNISRNKTTQDFANENKSFSRNFDRNFTNILEETDEQSNAPLYEFYTDRRMTNKIVVDKNCRFNSDPPKYEVIVNSFKSYLTNSEIQKLLLDINAIRVDKI